MMINSKIFYSYTKLPDKETDHTDQIKNNHMTFSKYLQFSMPFFPKISLSIIYTLFFFFSNSILHFRQLSSHSWLSPLAAIL